MTALLLGIVSSLAATAIFIGLSELTRRVLIPWFSDAIYRGVRLDGDWELHNFEGEPAPPGVEMTLMLRQSSDRLIGTYAHKTEGSRRDTYSVVGIIRDGYFLAYATPTSNRHMDGISMLLHIHTKRDNLLLTGGVLCCGDPGEVSALQPITFRLVGR